MNPMRIAPRHIVYWLLSLGSLGLLAFDAPRGRLLTLEPDRGEVEKGTGTVRGRPIYVWSGGGYHGGK
ncbi:MAG: hypothetical protein K1X88_34250 [Nannocystaceae bacterium]|nr:hypothetical protein [Nannocystaceae bacterium]